MQTRIYCESISFGHIIFYAVFAYLFRTMGKVKIILIIYSKPQSYKLKINNANYARFHVLNTYNIEMRGRPSINYFTNEISKTVCWIIRIIIV